MVSEIFLANFSAATIIYLDVYDSIGYRAAGVSNRGLDSCRLARHRVEGLKRRARRITGRGRLRSSGTAKPLGHGVLSLLVLRCVAGVIRTTHVWIRRPLPQLHALEERLGAPVLEQGFVVIRLLRLVCRSAQGIIPGLIVRAGHASIPDFGKHNWFIPTLLKRADLFVVPVAPCAFEGSHIARRIEIEVCRDADKVELVPKRGVIDFVVPAVPAPICPITQEALINRSDLVDHRAPTRAVIRILHLARHVDEFHTHH